MAINVSVQYNGGSLPDIILLTQGYYRWGTHLNAVKRLYILTMKQHFIHVVESSCGLVVKRKYISLYQLQYCNISCVLD